MDSTVCRFCSQQFYSSFNRRRHEKKVHNKELKEIKHNDSDQESSIGSEDSNDTEESENHIYHEDEDSESETSSENEENLWPALIEKTCRGLDLKNEIKHPKELFYEPILSKFLEELRDHTEKRLKFADFMTKHDKIYKEIQNTAEGYEENALYGDEAIEKAWNERKYLLKRMLRDNLDVIGRMLAEETSDSEDDEDEDEESEA